MTVRLMTSSPVFPETMVLLAYADKEHSRVSDKLGDEFLCKAPDCILLSSSGEPEQQFLDARILIRGDPFADGFGTAN